MFFQRMNNVLVKHNKWLFGIFAVIIIISFVWFFTPGVDGSLLFGRGGADSEYGSVFDEEITYTDLYELMSCIDLVNGLQSGTGPSGMGHSTDDQVLRNVFSYAALIKTAQMQGLYVTDEDVAKYLAAFPLFMENGKFSAALYRKFIDEKLVRYGYSESDLTNALKTMMLIDKLNSFAVNNVVVTDHEIADFMSEMMTMIHARKVVLEKEPFQKALKPTEDELLAYYAANPDSFMTQPVSAGVVAYLPYTVKMDVKNPTEEQINDMLALYDDEDKKDIAALKARITAELRKKMVADAVAERVIDFAHVMKALSKQPEYEDGPEAHFRNEAAKLGLEIMDVKDLTPVTLPVDLVEADLIRALTSLKNVSSVTNVIKGTNGCYVAILTERKGAEVAKFADVKAEVEKVFRIQKVAALCQEAVNKLRSDLTASENPGADLEKIAAAAGAKVMAYPAFSAFSVMKNPVMLLPEDQMLQYLIFQTKNETLSMAIPSESEYTMVFVDKRVSPAADVWQKEVNSEYQQNCLDIKKQQALETFQNWVFRNARIVELPQQAN